MARKIALAVERGDIVPGQNLSLRAFAEKTQISLKAVKSAVEMVEIIQHLPVAISKTTFEDSAGGQRFAVLVEIARGKTTTER